MNTFVFVQTFIDLLQRPDRGAVNYETFRKFYRDSLVKGNTHEIIACRRVNNALKFHIKEKIKCKLCRTEVYLASGGQDLCITCAINNRYVYL